MLDRLHLVMPRLGGAGIRGGTGDAVALPELRLGANAMDLIRLRHRLPPAVGVGVGSLTKSLADFLRAPGQQPELEPSDALRDQLDRLLSAVARTISDHRESALLALAGIRVVPFRDHSPIMPM